MFRYMILVGSLLLLFSGCSSRQPDLDDSAVEAQSDSYKFYKRAVSLYEYEGSTNIYVVKPEDIYKENIRLLAEIENEILATPISEGDAVMVLKKGFHLAGGVGIWGIGVDEHTTYHVEYIYRDLFALVKRYPFSQKSQIELMTFAFDTIRHLSYERLQAPLSNLYLNTLSQMSFLGMLNEQLFYPEIFAYVEDSMGSMFGWNEMKIKHIGDLIKNVSTLKLSDKAKSEKLELAISLVFKIKERYIDEHSGGIITKAAFAVAPLLEQSGYPKEAQTLLAQLFERIPILEEYPMMGADDLPDSEWTRVYTGSLRTLRTASISDDLKRKIAQIAEPLHKRLYLEDNSEIESCTKSVVFSELGLLFAQLDRYEKGIDYFNRSIQNFNAIKKGTFSALGAHQNRPYKPWAKKKLDQALTEGIDLYLSKQRYDEALQLTQHQEPDQKSKTMQKISKSLWKGGQQERVIAFIEKADTAENRAILLDVILKEDFSAVSKKAKSLVVQETLALLENTSDTRYMQMALQAGDLLLDKKEAIFDTVFSKVKKASASEANDVILVQLADYYGKKEHYQNVLSIISETKSMGTKSEIVQAMLRNKKLLDSDYIKEVTSLAKNLAKGDKQGDILMNLAHAALEEAGVDEEMLSLVQELYEIGAKIQNGQLKSMVIDKLLAYLADSSVKGKEAEALFTILYEGADQSDRQKIGSSLASYEKQKQQKERANVQVETEALPNTVAQTGSSDIKKLPPAVEALIKSAMQKVHDGDIGGSLNEFDQAIEMGIEERFEIRRYLSRYLIKAGRLAALK